MSEIKNTNVNESAMGEIDIIAQESKTFKEFVKEFHKEFSLIELDRETIKWLEGIWKGNNRNESVNEEEKSPEEIVQGLRQMALGDLERIEDYAEMISDRMEQGQELSSWMYSQITLAVDQLNSVHDSLDGKDGVKEESVNEASYVNGYAVKAKTPYEFVNGAYAVLSAYLRDEQIGPKGKKELQNILKSLDYMRKYFFFKLDESINEVGSGDWHFKEIKKLWDKAGSFTRKKIAGLITKNPNSTWDKIEKVLRGSDYDDATYYTDMLHLESLKEAKAYKKGDKLKIKLPNGKKFDVVFDAYSKQKGVAFGKFRDSSGEYDIKPFSLDTIIESVNEAPAAKIKNTITKKEWSKIAKYNKHIGMDGTHYVMKYDDKIGTYLQAVKLVDEIKEGGCGCGCGCGGAKLESKDGLERVAQGLPQTEEEPLNEWRAEEVLQQMGGRRFIAMTGAKNFVKNDPKKQITFKIGGGAKGGINYVRITLTSMDLYTMEFIKARGTDLKVVATEKGVYNDQLQQMFTKHTGMHTRL